MNFKKFRIPDGTDLAANGFKVFYENQLDSGAGSLVPFTFDSAHGDQAYVSEADAGGDLTGYRSVVQFGASANGVSFGRYVTSVGADFVAMNRHTFGVSNPSSVTQFRTGDGAANAYPMVGPIVFSEIMYHPVSGTGTNISEPAEEEFIELQNISTNGVALYDPAYPTNTWKLEGGIGFVFPSGTLLSTGKVMLVVGFDPVTNAPAMTALRNKYGIPAGVSILGPFEGRLDNHADQVALLRPDAPQQPPHTDAGFVPYILVEQVSYEDTAPWPSSADGGGDSLQRKNPAEYGNDPVNWTAEAPTAGRPNTVTTPLIQVEVGSVTDTSVTLSWNTVAGRTYRVQYKSDLSEPSWTDLSGDIASDATTATKVDGSSNGVRQRYYRIMIVE